MSRYTKWVVLLLVLIVLLAPTALAAKAYKYTIGFTVGHMGQPTHSRVWKQAVERGKELGIKVLVMDDREWDLGVESANVDQFISMKVDGLLMMGVSEEGSVAAAQRAKAAGIPVVGLWDNVKGFPYVGSNFIDGGGASLVADAIIKKLGGKGNIVYLRGSAGAGVERTRDNGFQQAIAKYPGIKIVYQNHANWVREQGTQHMEAALTRFPQKGSINAVFAHNDDMALGALEAIRRAGRLNDPIYIFAIDGVPAMIQAIQRGEVEMTAFQNAELAGCRGVEYMYKILNGKKVPNQVDIPWSVITKDNADEWMERYNETTGMFLLPEEQKEKFNY